MSKEYPCVYYDNEKCKFFSKDGVTSYCVLGPCGHETPSNADRIRAMSDEELSVFLWSFDVAKISRDKDYPAALLRTHLTNWLQQPCGGADHE